jgi:hypothetical protein
MRRPKDAFERLGQSGVVVLTACGEDGGAIDFRRQGDAEMRIVFSWGLRWDHVSVSLSDRCPTWDEMEMVKRAFFRDSETAVQFHVPPSEHINCHPYCLHLWRPQRTKIPRPPGYMVGLKAREKI